MLNKIPLDCPSNSDERVFWLNRIGWYGLILLDPKVRTEIDDIRDADGFHVLHLAAWSGADRVAKIAITQSPSLVDAGNVDGWRPLHLAAWNDDLTIMEMLHEAGVSLSVEDERGWTPLHWAASGGSKEAIRFLIKAGADIRAVTKENETALHIAAVTGRFNVFRELCDAGVDPSLCDAAQETAMDVIEFAAKRWHSGAKSELRKCIGRTNLKRG
jgi:ankyrin repeat protein